jgi:hypothetical protein
MTSHEPQITDGPAVGGWIKPRLGGEFGAVTLQVPKGFDAYARIFHPASDSDGNRVTWTDVAKARGTTPHPEMQWHAILGFAAPDELYGSHTSVDPDSAAWRGSHPSIGLMDIQTLDALCDILTVHTADPIHCFFGLCTIAGWMDSISTSEVRSLLELPYGRDYLVLAGALSTVNQITYIWPRPESLQVTFTTDKDEALLPKLNPTKLRQREAPNLIWPVDHTWLVASEVDFDSTLVGGSASLIEEIVESQQLEACQVRPTDSLAVDADKVNVTKRH